MLQYCVLNSLVCVWLCSKQVLRLVMCLFMLRFFNYHLARSWAAVRSSYLMFGHLSCVVLEWIHYCYHFARHSPNNRAIIGHHKCLFELWVCFTTQVRRLLSSSATTTSSASCQTSSQGFEILSRWTAFADPAPFRSIELFRLGRWALCHTADSFKRPTWNI